MEQLQHLLNKVNRVTAYHRRGNTIPKSALDELSNAQIEYEKSFPVDKPVKPEIALSGRLEYEKLEEVAAQRTKELREYMEQFKNDKGQTIYEALQR